MTIWLRSVKWIVYGVLLLLLTLLQIAVLPHFKPFGVHAFPLPLFSVILSLFEGYKAGGIFGFAAGLMCDAFIPPSEMFFTIFLMLASILAGIAVERLFRRNIVTAALWSASIFAVMELLYYTFFFFFTGKAGLSALWIAGLPEMAVTLPWIAVLYFVIGRTHKAQKQDA